MNHSLLKLLILLLALSATVGASAQWSPPPPLETVDLPAANAKTIVTGFLESFGPAGGTGQHQIEIQVNERLKGSAPPKLTASIRTRVPDEQFSQWRSARSLLLLAIPTDGSQLTTIIDLSAKNLAVISAEMKLLTKPADVIRAVKVAVSAARGMTNVDRSMAIIPSSVIAGTPLQNQAYIWPNHTTEISIPIDHRQEKVAIRQLRSDQTRLAGIRILRHFKSDANIARLEPLLKSEDWAGSFSYERNKEYVFQDNAVRRAAFDALRSFGIPTPAPVTIRPSKRNEQVVSADLDDHKVGLDEIKELEKYPNLVDLSLSKAQLNPSEFQELEKLSSLRMIYFQASNLTDADLPDLQLLPHLTYLDLAATGITDTGLDELVPLKQLKKVELGQACTEHGIEKLRRKRPDLTVQTDEFAFLSALHPRRVEMGFRGRSAHPPGGKILDVWRYGLIFPREAASQVTELLSKVLPRHGWTPGCPAEQSLAGYHRDRIRSGKTLLQDDVCLFQAGPDGVEQGWGVSSDRGGRLVVVERVTQGD